MKREDWNKFVKVFSLDVDVTVKKEVTKADVILSLLDEGEIAFRGKKGNMFVMKVTDKWDLDLLEKVILNPIKEEFQKSTLGVINNPTTGLNNNAHNLPGVGGGQTKGSGLGDAVKHVQQDEVPSETGAKEPIQQEMKGLWDKDYVKTNESVGEKHGK